MEGELTGFSAEGVADALGRSLTWNFRNSAGNRMTVGIEHQRSLDAPTSRHIADIQLDKSAHPTAFATQLPVKLRKVVDMIGHKLQDSLATHHHAGKQLVAKGYRPGATHRALDDPAGGLKRPADS